MFLLVTVLFLQVSLGILFVLPQTHLQDKGCNIVISNLDPEPVVVDGSYQFLYADPEASVVSIRTGDTIIISCPGGQIFIGPNESNTTASATCISNTDFMVNSKTIDFNQITCSRNPFHTARYTGNGCEADGKEIEIGFILNDDTFVRQVITCFDATNLNSLYSTYNITKSIGHYERGVNRPFFVEDDFYNLEKKVNDLYVRRGQKATINSLLGLPPDSTKYIQDTTDYFLARGHLAAKADFVYAPQQTATFHYINVASQWQTFNDGNWNTAEMDVRIYAENHGVDLRMYTGTYGVTTLPHAETGEEIPLHLYVGSDGVQGIAVPELYWKVAYNPETKQGVALLGANNPYRKEVAIICKDISSSITWLTWNATNLQAGYSYACSVDDFRKKINYLPDFEVQGLLL